MTKIIVGAISASFLTLNLIAAENDFKAELLTGDTKLACEAILCLSSSTRPSECNPSLNHYFSLKAKKWKNTVKLRRNFLKLCPDGGDEIEDLVYKDYRDNFLPNAADPRECTAEYLNKQLENKEEFSYLENKFSLSYRVNPNMPAPCITLFKHPYTAISKPNYICTGEFYTSLEWKLNAKLIRISYKDYTYLPNYEKYEIYIPDGEGGYTNYYKKVPFSKTCWMD
ncbi:TrbM/KikA/MpfK family conjugal transfer protein [Arcobacter defluvii]|uniref:Type IV conjugative transfer system protein TrbM n=1 Tax=Arcobacter defluvii TaxID=873191 RepID=A0AAE7E6S2_9BACT|nr:TrbM/KikA/MpfK family conjugal transfer protein [Arcobacter defluvii]QKF77286.1 type IV conjugative transfer system protein TrbM [Arcobacter defluvii]QKF77870.1 type IV conjugative transfer system protein TrbM [Arcobacter defluvii]RXI32651.1 conjugal transfer protein TrbM [Arcobacter defluvii]